MQVDHPDELHPDLQPGDERTALEQRLDQYRDIVSSKLADLDHVKATSRPLVATDLSISGIVKHLAWAEDHWFQRRLLGGDLRASPPSMPLPPRLPSVAEAGSTSGGSLCT
jgi:hypothetical protein